MLVKRVVAFCVFIHCQIYIFLFENICNNTMVVRDLLLFVYIYTKIYLFLQGVRKVWRHGESHYKVLLQVVFHCFKRVYLMSHAQYMRVNLASLLMYSALILGLRLLNPTCSRARPRRASFDIGPPKHVSYKLLSGQNAMIHC